jgi:hypothetical protein
MKHFLLALSLALALSACAPSNGFSADDYADSEDLFSTICLDGVEYWVRAAASKSYLAVRIDPETLQPRRCTKQD